MTPDLQKIQWVHCALVVFVAVLASITGVLSGWGVLFGGAVMGLNFWLLRRIFGFLLSPDVSRRPTTIVALGVAKQLIFLGLISLVFWRIELDAVAFAIGVTILLVACLTVTLVRQPVTA